MSRSSRGGDCSHEEAYATSHRRSTRKRSQVELTIGIDLGDVWSHYCALNQQGDVIDRGRFRTTPKAFGKWFTDEAFFRVEGARDTARGGTGLGLSIAKRAILLHQGSMSAVNASPGFKVSIALPLPQKQQY